MTSSSFRWTFLQKFVSTLYGFLISSVLWKVFKTSVNSETKIFKLLIPLFFRAFVSTPIKQKFLQKKKSFSRHHEDFSCFFSPPPLAACTKVEWMYRGYTIIYNCFAILSGKLSLIWFFCFCLLWREQQKQWEFTKKRNYKHRASELIVLLGNLCLEIFLRLFYS